MAGCDCRKDIFKISYDNLSSEVASQHTGWTSTQVRQETARLFRPSFTQNMKSVRQERSNEKVYQGADFVVEDGNVNFVDGIRTTNILSFHETQRRDRPEEYSPEQHSTSLLIQAAFRNGATEVITSYPEQKGQRDILVMKLDRETGKGTSYVINTATDGNDHSVSEIERIAKSHFADYAETRAADNVFILSDVQVSVPSSDVVIRENPRAAEVSESVTKYEHGHDKSAVRELPRHIQSPEPASPQVFMNIDRTAREIPQIVATVVEKTAGEIAFTAHAVHRYFERNRAEDTLYEAQKEAPISPGEMGVEKKTEVVRESVDGLPVKRDVSAKRKIVKASMGMLASARRIEKQTVVAIHKKAVGKSILRQERVVGKRNLQKEKRMSKGKRASKEKYTSLPLTGDRIVDGKQKNSAIERRTVRTRKMKYEKVSTERRINAVRSRRITEKAVPQVAFLQKLVRRLDQQTGISSSRREQLKMRTEKSTIHFSTAFILWMLTNHNNILTNENESVQEKRDMLITREPTPWLLLAIIWHLAMIREQGFVHSGANNKQTAMKKKKLVLPPMGVIFAYAT